MCQKAGWHQPDWLLFVSEGNLLRRWSQALFGAAEQQDKRTWAETDAQKLHLNRTKYFFIVQVNEHWNNCLEWVWSLPHWRYSGSIWMQFCATYPGKTLLVQGGVTRWPRLWPLSNLDHSVILWSPNTSPASQKDSSSQSLVGTCPVKPLLNVHVLWNFCQMWSLFQLF